MAKKRQVPIGQAIRWSEEEIDSFLEVAAEDIDQLRSLWRKYARNKDLIDATLQDETIDAITGNQAQ